MQRPLFALGRLVQTKAVSERFTAGQLSELVRRHGRGDWGNVSNEDAQANALALQDEARIMSVYEVAIAGAEPVKLWIITEADRSATTILFPEEY